MVIMAIAGKQAFACFPAACRQKSWFSQPPVAAAFEPAESRAAGFAMSSGRTSGSDGKE
jgi:hypothetical protein